MKSIYYREQKHICGKNYDTAPYMEVDLYPVTPKQHKASRRAKRKEASTLAQQTYNDNRAKRYHVQLVNANFGKGDFSWTGTYDDDHHPEPGDTAKADRDLTNYIKRLYRWCDKNGVQRPKWVAATEYGRSSKALHLTTAPSLRRRRSWNALASTSTYPGRKCISAIRIPLGSEAPTRIPTA